MKHWFLCASLFVATTSFGQETNMAFGDPDHDNSAPVEITSDTLDIDDTAGIAIFEGSVVAQQSTMTVSGDVMHAYYSEAREIERVEVFGNMIFISGEDRSEAEEGVYLVPQEQVEMTQNVVITRGTSMTATGDDAKIDLANNTAKLIGNVKTIFVPKANE